MEESAVWLRSGATGEPIEASLCDEVTDEHLRMWDDSWVREMRRFCAGRQAEDKPEDAHWDWRKKARDWRGLLGYTRLGPDVAHQGLTYFEMTETQADAFRRNQMKQ